MHDSFLFIRLTRLIHWHHHDVVFIILRNFFGFVFVCKLLQNLFVLSRLQFSFFEALKRSMQLERCFGLSWLHWLRFHFQEWHEFSSLFYFVKICQFDKIVYLLDSKGCCARAWTHSSVARMWFPTSSLACFSNLILVWDSMTCLKKPGYIVPTTSIKN